MLKTYLTKYGTLKGITTLDTYPNKDIKSCNLESENSLRTSSGKFIPYYLDSGTQNSDNTTLDFYENGSLKNIHLLQPKNILTSLGCLTTQHLSFYDDETIQWIYPISSENDSLPNKTDSSGAIIEFNLAIGSFSTKVLCLSFYKSGNLDTITLCPQEKIEIQTPDGLVTIRNGFSLYENGQIKSFEPAIPEPISTPIGIVMAYNPIITLNTNNHDSVIYNPSGKLQSVKTIFNKVIVTQPNNKEIIEPPLYSDSSSSSHPVKTPLTLNFLLDTLEISNISHIIGKYPIVNTKTLLMESFEKKSCSTCSGCSSCK